MRSSSAASRGFTLIEVLVAVAVLAIALAAVIKIGSESGGNLIYLRDKTLAHWVAENRLAEMRAMEEWPSGEGSGSSQFAGREWFWKTQVKEFPDPNIRHVIIRVSEREGSEEYLTVLHGVLGNPELRKGSPGFGGGGPGGGEPNNGASPDEQQNPPDQSGGEPAPDNPGGTGGQSTVGDGGSVEGVDGTQSNQEPEPPPEEEQPPPPPPPMEPPTDDP